MSETVQNRTSFSVLGVSPARAIAPLSGEEVAGALAEARSRGDAVIPFGGGTMVGIGDMPARYDVALSTAAVTGIVEYEPADLTIVARAGTTIEELNAELARNGQFLPLQPPLPERATLGGVLAANASGPWRSAFGSARDFVIGMRMALPSGQLAKSGGRVVKNVAGYDLAKLFIGSHGSLGVIVEAALKVYPSPPEVHTFVLRAPTLSEALELSGPVRALGPGVLSLAVFNAELGRKLGTDTAGALVTVGGTPRAAVALAEALLALGGHTIELDLLGNLEDYPARATARISTVPGNVHAALDLDIPAEALIYPLTGLTYVRSDQLDAKRITALRERLAPSGGSVVLIDVPLDIRQRAGTWGPIGPELALMRKVKDVFDPDRTMSPGRFVGGL